jgi:hypothetical protein
MRTPGIEFIANFKKFAKPIPRCGVYFESRMTQNKCAHRESNPGPLRGKQRFYH